MYAQLPEDASDVVSHGVRTETQNLRNAARGLALRKKRQDVLLPAGELHTSTALVNLVEKTADHSQRKRKLPVQGGADRQS